MEICKANLGSKPKAGIPPAPFLFGISLHTSSLDGFFAIRLKYKHILFGQAALFCHLKAIFKLTCPFQQITSRKQICKPFGIFSSFNHVCPFLYLMRLQLLRKVTVLCALNPAINKLLQLISSINKFSQFSFRTSVLSRLSDFTISLFVLIPSIS